MKAVILAGGEGTRLRPVSSGLPKPMVPLLGKPVLEHAIALLRRCGITQVCMTLRFLPSLITGYFGGGEDFGAELSYRVEHEALGTAGSVRACLDFTGNEDFLVLSGDAVCDFDLTEIISRHRETKADATIVLTRCVSPLEYGLAVTDENGRITGFVEKPGWNEAVTDLVNTGIYIISPEILKRYPENVMLDFAKDVFPDMLRRGDRLFGFAASGAWCDIGSPESYLSCSLDAIGGKIKPEASPEAKSGDFCASNAENVTLNAPYFIESGVKLCPGAVIGPEAVICRGSVISPGARIEKSVINGAFIGEGSRIGGSIVCAGASVGSGAELCPGSVVGNGARIGDGACVCEGVKIYPSCAVLPGEKAVRDIAPGAFHPPLSLPSAHVRGEYGCDVTPESCALLGAAASLYPRIGTGSDGGVSLLCMEAFEAAARARGSEIFRFDASFPALAAFASERFSVPFTVFFSSGGSDIRFFSSSGLPAESAELKKLERAMKAPPPAVSPLSAGGFTEISGTEKAYISAAEKAVFSEKPRFSVCAAVIGKSAAAKAMREIFARIGVQTAAPEPGSIVFEPAADGFSFTATDESGAKLSSSRLLLICAMAELEAGAKVLAAPVSASAALDALAARYGAEIERGEHLCPSAPFAAAKIMSFIAARGTSLSALSSLVPESFDTRREIALESPRASVMRILSHTFGDKPQSFSHGLFVVESGGTARIFPSARANALTLICESFSAEAASELSLRFEDAVKKAETELRG